MIYQLSQNYILSFSLVFNQISLNELRPHLPPQKRTLQTNVFMFKVFKWHFDTSFQYLHE